MTRLKPKTPWQIYVEKRAGRNRRLVSMATSRLQREYTEMGTLPAQTQLGIHLGLITLTNCSTKIVDIRSRARWMLHWMLGYLLDQGFTVEEASTDNALDALEALVMAAAQVREKQPPHMIHLKASKLLHADGTPVPNTWTDVYNTAWKFIAALDNNA